MKLAYSPDLHSTGESKLALTKTMRFNIRQYLMNELDSALGLPARAAVDLKIARFTSAWLMPLYSDPTGYSLLNEAMPKSENLYIPVMTPNGIEIVALALLGHPSDPNNQIGPITLPAPACFLSTVEEWEEQAPFMLKLLAVSPRQRDLVSRLDEIVAHTQSYQAMTEQLTYGIDGMTSLARRVSQLVRMIGIVPDLSSHLPLNWEDHINQIAEVSHSPIVQETDFEQAVNKLLELGRALDK